ncbi:MAG: D-alanyl-D-alanine carboxypeptidase [Candidatus Terrybacteria bacterium]|nr:D-alanyl-D-alanine carboxypeptidase [Candidatus Terrybacteria bacterium]
MLSGFRTLVLCGALLAVVMWSYALIQAESAIRLPVLTPPEMPGSRVPSDARVPATLHAALPETLLRESPPPWPQRKEGVPDIILESRAAYAVTDESRELFALNAEETLPIASITKLLTALLVLDRLPLEAPVPITLAAIQVEGDSAHLSAGETLSAHDAILALLLPSSNDAAFALAQAAGGLSDFIAALNTKAQAIGMTTPHFTNPHGLAPPGNTATAKDTAALLREAIRKPILRDMLQQAQVEVQSKDGRRHLFENTDILLSRLPGALGGKTGYTLESQGTLVFAFSPMAALESRQVQQEDTVVITAVLGSKDRFADTEALARWVLQAYAWQER